MQYATIITIQQVMVDANQKWGVREAIDWMKNLAEFKLVNYTSKTSAPIAN